jgi:hypothetical protein
MAANMCVLPALRMCMNTSVYVKCLMFEYMLRYYNDNDDVCAGIPSEPSK